jgi:hypothetical protein
MIAPGPSATATTAVSTAVAASKKEAASPFCFVLPEA